MGVKLVVICGLAVLMTIPSLFVSGLVNDRTRRAADVTREISSHVGGPQTFLGPTLAVPYTIASASLGTAPSRGVYFVSPAQATVSLKTATTQRHRSLFRVPVFHADLLLDSFFDLQGVPSNAPLGADLDWSHAEIVVGVSDTRGALADATLATRAKILALAPAQLADRITVATHDDPRVKLCLLGAPISGVAHPDASFHVASTLKFSGAERIAVLAYGKTTRVTAQGDWPDPGFDGAFLPVSRSVSQRGFEAQWSVPFIARGIRAEGPNPLLADLNSVDLGLSFIEVADPYQSVNRSLKYALLILGLVFLSYFVFEVNTGKLLHPAQYILVGVAQIIFYLLLLSIAERIGFDLAFFLSAAATITLLSVNAGWVFASWLQTFRASLSFSTLYTLIYLLLRLDDNALLVGAIGSFLTIAAIMYFTRRIDWYGSAIAASSR